MLLALSTFRILQKHYLLLVAGPEVVELIEGRNVIIDMGLGPLDCAGQQEDNLDDLLILRNLPMKALQVPDVGAVLQGGMPIRADTSHQQKRDLSFQKPLSVIVGAHL